MKNPKYWNTLVDRVYNLKTELHGPERKYFIIRSMLGEIWVNGLVPFFEEHGHLYKEIRSDLLSQNMSNFVKLVDGMERLLFKDGVSLNKSENVAVISKYYDVITSDDFSGNDEVEDYSASIKDELLKLSFDIDDWIEDYGLKNRLYNEVTA
jgi:hypothetical protein